MKHRDRTSAMKVSVGAALCVLFGYMMSQHFGQIWPLEHSSDRPILDISYKATLNPVVTSLELSSASFESTLRSCLGPNCFDEMARDSSGLSNDRVGLLAPLHSGGELISQFLNSLRPQKSKKSSVELIYETHVPTYGYGKNHGWSRIIRLTRKIVPHALSLVADLNLDDIGLKGTRQEKLSAALDIQVRQLVRWHCRLSHVAAHTKLLTVFIEDLIDKPAIALEMMLTFTGFPFSRPDMMIAIPAFISEMKKSLAIPITDFQRPPSSGANNGTISGSINIKDSPEGLLKIPEGYLKVSVSAIMDEFESTKGFTRWPCESFRSIVPYGKAGGRQTEEHRQLRDRLKMSPSMAAANCSSPFVKCSVRFDTQGG